MTTDKSDLIRSLRLDDVDRGGEPRNIGSEPASRDDAIGGVKNAQQQPTRTAPEVDAEKRRPAWAIAGLAGTLGVAVGGAAVFLFAPGSVPQQTDTPSSREAQAATAVPTTGSLVASGYVVARRQATVAAEITGRLVEVRFEEGQFVQQGQILAVLDQSIAAAELQMSRNRQAAAASNVDASLAELRDAGRALERSRELQQRGFATRADLDRAEARAATARARLEQARANVALAASERSRAALQVSQHLVRAPFSGIVVSKNAQAGEIVSPISAGGGFTRTGIATLVDVNSLEFEVDVSEQYIAQIRPGQRVEARLNAYPDRVYEGRVIATIPTADRNRSTVRVRVGFDRQDNDILPDMAVRVTFLRG